MASNRVYTAQFIVMVRIIFTDMLITRLYLINLVTQNVPMINLQIESGCLIYAALRQNLDALNYL